MSKEVKKKALNEVVNPVEGGLYQLGCDRLSVIAVGQYAGLLAVVSRMNNGDCLTIWPLRHWQIEYGRGKLLSIDKTVSQNIVRGHGHWLGAGCLVSQVSGNILLQDSEVLSNADW